MRQKFYCPDHVGLGARESNFVLLPQSGGLLTICFSFPMTPLRWLIAAFWLFAFWLYAGWVVAPGIQRGLSARASATVASLPTGYSPVQVRFDGQRAILTGRVRKDSQRAEILSTVQNRLRTEGPLSSRLNPVQQVSDELDLSPYPAGWLLLAANGTRGQLLGTSASDFEARDLHALLEDRWNAQGGHLENRVKTMPDLHDEATDLKPTLAKLPLPDSRGGGDSAQVQISRIGGEWRRLVIDAKDDLLREQTLALGISAPDWEKSILPLIQSVRRYQSEERQRLVEAERQARLPPPHVFLAAREKRLLVRGELASMSLKRELLNSLISTFPEWRVLDDLRVNPQRRAIAEFGPITSALLPDEQDEDTKTRGKSLFLGLSGAAWQPVDWLVSSTAQPWKELLPSDLSSELLLADHRMVIDWLQGKATGIPALPIRAQPSFLTLTLLPGKVILAGQLAEEALHTQLLEAVRQKYAAAASINTESLLVRGTCEPSADIQQTLRSLPPLPAADSQGSLAFARPGSVWKSLPASPGIEQPGAIAKVGLLPTDFPAAMAEDTFWDGFEYLRQHWKSLVKPANPAQP